MKRLTLLMLGASLGCSLDLGVPSDLTVTCTTNAQCPEGTICDTNVGSCVASDTPTLRVDVPLSPTRRYTRNVPFTVEALSANAATSFDIAVEFRDADAAEVRWRPLALTLDSASTMGVVGSPSGSAYALAWDALHDAIDDNGVSLARVDLDADGQVADPIVAPARIIIRAIPRAPDGASRGQPAESVPFLIGNAPPVATIADVIGESGVINVVVGLLDANADGCGFELQFRGPDGVWRNAALEYGNTTSLGCLSAQPLSASVGWNSRAELFDPEVRPATTPQGVGQTIVPNAESTARVTVRARAYDEAEAARPEQHWGVWSPPFVIRRIVNQTSPVITSATAPLTAIAGGPGPVHIRYTVVDAESDPVDATISYSNDAGGSWLPAEEYAYAMSEGTRQLTSAPAADGGVQHLFTWDASRGHVRPASSTLVRIVLSDGSLAGASTTTFQLGSPAAPSGAAPHDDLVHALFTSTLYLNDGTTVAALGEAVAIADFNNDGAKDFVVAKPGNSLSIFRNTGAAVPWPQTHLNGSFTRVVAANLLNNTSRQSLIVLDTAGVGGAYTGNGNMTFALDTSINLGAEPIVMLARDVDNDGDDDFIVERADSSNAYTLLVYRNSGTSGSRFQLVYSVTYDSMFGLDAADLDQDGIVDIALLTNNREGRIYRGAGNGQFTELLGFDGTHSNRDVDLLLGDVNGDGLRDLVNLGNGTVSYLMASVSGGTLAYERRDVTLAVPTGRAVAADLNGDGLSDFVTGNQSDQTFALVLSALDTAGRPAPRTARTGFFNTGFGVDDLDGDHIAEIVALSGNGFGQVTVAVVDGPANAGGQLVGSGPSLPGRELSGVPVVASFDGDGVPDLLLVGERSTLYRGAGAAGVGDASFGAPETIFLAEGDLRMREAVAADINGDGALDIAFLATAGDYYSGALFMGFSMARPLQGVTDGRFAPVQLRQLSPVTGTQPSQALVTADFDDDGFDDVAYLYVNDTGPVFSLGVAFSRGAAGFTQEDATYVTPNTARALTVGYVGADVLPDVVATVADDTARIYSNAVSPVSRTNPFTATNVVLGLGTDAVQLADLNGDGVTDLWTRTGTTLTMRLGIAAGGFGAAFQAIPNAFMSNVRLFDITLDGVNDFVFLGFPYNNQGGVMAGAAPLGVPNATFAVPTTFVIDDVQGNIAITPTDVTCDGVTDLAIAQAGDQARLLVGHRDAFTPQLAVAAPPYDGRHVGLLANLGLGTTAPLHAWHVAGGAPCSEHERWQDALESWRATHAQSPRFRVLGPGRYLGETSRYQKTRVGSEMRWVRSSRFDPALTLASEGAPRGLVATLTVVAGRRASVVPAKVHVYRQVATQRSAADQPQDTQAAHPDAANILAQLPTSHGLVDLAQRAWSWEEIPRDGDGVLQTGTGRRFVYDASRGLADILTDEGGFYVVVEDL